MAVVTQIQIRRGTAAQWTSSNPILAAGEQGFETDTNKFKIGNGSTAWTSLAYAAGTGTVTSITAGTGLSGGTITSSGTIAVDNVAIANGGTGKTTAPAAMAALMGYTSTATAAGTTTLTNTSSYYQQFTGTTTQTVVLPVTSTLQTGWTFHIVNNSTGLVTVNSSGGNQVIIIPAGTTAMVTCIGTTLTTAADWEYGVTDFSTYTGTGDVVLATSPSLTAPLINLGYSAKTSNYTVALADNGYLLSMNNASATTFSIPTNASVAFPVGAQISFAWITGAGQPSIAAVTSGTTTILSTGATSTAPKLRVANSTATAVKLATDTWLVIGDIS